MGQITGTNPILYTDYPDPDVIRVGDTYYMVSTTMHFMPGGVILRSYDLIHWEIASYVYDVLEDTPGQRLADEKGVYGKGMWAAAIRYHKEMFYVCFVANDTGKTYLYRAKEITGPWKKSTIEGFYHDSSLLFDDDGRVYVYYVSWDNGVYGIYGVEYNRTLTAQAVQRFADARDAACDFPPLLQFDTHCTSTRCPTVSVPSVIGCTRA